MEHLKYPIGKFAMPESVTPEMRAAWIEKIAALPQQLEAALAGISEAQLDTPYRPDGWTIRQVVHHLADSHINAYCRLHLSLTEDAPTIKPYSEGLWAQLADSQLPVESSLQILRGVHHRWVHLLRSMKEEDFARTYIHPAYGKVYSMDTMTGLYAWHGEHHIGHVKLVFKNDE
ncbi:MAG: putative metal-dependent hydrolase [Saprospiraceae bacterium]|nr:putative metal-dependent hydrolase [Saprospiraceae bacterium]